MELTRTLRQLEIPLAPKPPILETRRSSESFWEILTDKFGIGKQEDLGNT